MRIPAAPAGGLLAFSAQRLLGPYAEPSTTPLAHEAFLARAQAERERGADLGARLALGAYAVVRLLDAAILAGFDLADTEGAFTWQHARVRQYLDGLPGTEPEAAHLGGIVAALEQGPAAVRASLTGYAWHLEQEARLDEAHEALVLAVRTWPGEIPPAEFGPLALFVARLHRLRARWVEATDAYRAAEEAGRHCGDAVVMLRGQAGQGAVLRGQGNLPAARHAAELVAAEAEARGLRDIQAGAAADLGVVLMLMGRQVEALAALYDSFQYTTDLTARMRVVGDLGIGLADLGVVEAARTAFEIVIASGTSRLVRVNAQIELMELESRVGNRVAFEQLRQAVRGFADRMPPSMAVDFRYKAGLGLARFGQTGRARVLWEEGRAIAEARGLNEPFFRLERLLHGAPEAWMAEASRTEAPSEVTTDAASVSALRRMTVGLRLYASLAEAGRAT